MAEVTEPLAEEPEETDRWLLLLTVLLVGFGLLMVLSASQALSINQNRSPFYYFIRQAVLIGAGIVALLVLRRLDYHRLRRLAPAAAVVALLLMLLVLVPGIGVNVNGARRWFNAGALGSFQPSEIAKLVFAVFLAHWIDKRDERLRSLTDGLVPFAIMLGAVLALLMLQKDLGSALIITAIFISIYFSAGGSKVHLALLLAGLLVLFLLFTTLESYRSQRLTTFLHPFQDPLGTGFQSTQSILALGSGGFSGVGLGHSVQKYLWLPEAHTDFIFAIVGEETGLVGTTLVLLGFVLFAIRGYRAAMRAPDRFGVTLAVGITTWIALQALINMGTVTDTLPITGVPLPFISYGGTSVAVTLAAVGVLLNIAGQGGRQTLRRSDATLDIGRGDRRSRFPGARRRASLPR
jgi:cell division protein FtsW